MPEDLSHRTSRKLSPGWNTPLGATPGLGGVNFSLYSATAEEVWLLLFDRHDGDPTDIIRVRNRDRFAWHVFVHAAGAGQFTSLPAGEEFADDGAEPLPDPADRYLVHPRTTVELLGK